LFLLVAQIEWIFIVPLMGSQMNKGETLSTSSTLTCHNVLQKDSIEPKYDDFGLSHRRMRKKVTTSLAFCNFLPWALSCYLRRNLLTMALTTSWGLVTWPLLKKLHNILQPPIKFGYLDTKYHGLLFLNWATHLSLHTQCHWGVYLHSPMYCQWSLKQCYTNSKFAQETTQIIIWNIKKTIQNLNEISKNSKLFLPWALSCSLQNLKYKNDI